LDIDKLQAGMILLLKIHRTAP